MSPVLAKPFGGLEAVSASKSHLFCSDQIVKIKLSNEKTYFPSVCKKILTKNSILPSKFDVRKTFNNAMARIKQFPWMESLVILGACMVSLALGGHCMYGILAFLILLFLLLLCDNICFNCF
jgi:hypothetical protein